jgi:ATP-binding cassette subfamily G (WHITE) protein 2 (SNQ2)
MSEISGLFAQHRIIHRHKNAALYHPSVEAVALTLVDIPITFVTISIFAIILYFMVGLQQSAVSALPLMIFVSNGEVAESILVRDICLYHESH